MTLTFLANQQSAISDEDARRQGSPGPRDKNRGRKIDLGALSTPRSQASGLVLRYLCLPVFIWCKFAISSSCSRLQLGDKFGKNRLPGKSRAKGAQTAPIIGTGFAPDPLDALDHLVNVAVS